MWLSGLHIPESYLTALVQATCRKNGWPLDKSTLYTAVTKWLQPDEVTEKAHQGMILCYVLVYMVYCLRYCLLTKELSCQIFSVSNLVSYNFEKMLVTFMKIMLQECAPYQKSIFNLVKRQLCMYNDGMVVIY